MAVEHSTLTGASLHEPKGVEDADANTVYAADGAGSGAWTDINTLVTVTNFTTGDAKLTFKTTADSGWVMMDDGTIGDALSAGTTRANADCEDLFTLFWNNITDSWAAVSGGRGANAAADWAAHKTIALPKELGRSLLIAGAGSSLTTRALGERGGAESVALTEANLATHTHTATAGGNSADHTHTFSGNTGTESVTHTHDYIGGITTVQSGSGTNASAFATTQTSTESALHTHAYSGTTSGISAAHTHTITVGNTGSGTAHANMQPWSAINIMVKL